VGISSIFNLSDLYPYKEYDKGSEDQKGIQWEKSMLVEENPQMENIVDQRIGKKTSRITYIEYLVKWKGHLIQDVSWVNEADI
jgi:hypothetical protein